jgi:hypothetical protein
MDGFHPGVSGASGKAEAEAGLRTARFPFGKARRMIKAAPFPFREGTFPFREGLRFRILR